MPDDRRPGWLPGGLLGIAAGVLVGSIWRFGAWDVATAVTAVFLGLVAVLLTGAPGWRRFAVGLLAFALVAGGVLLAVGSDGIRVGG